MYPGRLQTKFWSLFCFPDQATARPFRETVISDPQWKIIHQELFDYKNQLAMGVFCLKETRTNLKKLLSIEFNDYFELV